MMIVDSIYKNFSEYDCENRILTNIVREKLLLYTDHEISKYNKNTNILFNHELPKNIIKRYENEITVSFVNPTVNSLESKFRGENQIFKNINSPVNDNSKEMDRKSMGREIFSKCLEEKGKEFIDKRKKNVGEQKMNKSNHRFMKKNENELIGNFSENSNNKKNEYNNKYIEKSEKINILKNGIILNKYQKQAININKYSEKLQNLVTQINKPVLESISKLKILKKTINYDSNLVNTIHMKKSEKYKPIIRSKSINLSYYKSNKRNSMLNDSNNNKLKKIFDDNFKNYALDRYLNLLSTNKLNSDLKSITPTRKETSNKMAEIEILNQKLINTCDEKPLYYSSKNFRSDFNYSNNVGNKINEKTIILENDEYHRNCKDGDKMENKVNSHVKNQSIKAFLKTNPSMSPVFEKERENFHEIVQPYETILKLHECKKLESNKIIKLHKCKRKPSNTSDSPMINSSDISSSRSFQSETSNIMSLVSSTISDSISTVSTESFIL